ncbi:inositol polyphosphate-5-phosphatase A isoform X2 [Diachasmimorpha longicaudata]
MSGIPVLLITANVGSIFEEPATMLKVWTEEFLSTVSRLDPKFIALHCQEVGGKNYEQSMRHVEDFVRLLMSSEELRLFDKVRVYLDEDFSSAEHFTALGNFYFVHESLKDVLLWDFKDCTFISVSGKEVHSGNIEAVTTKEKAKFPQDFFPECKWSRKGFLRTRWSVSGTVFDLINIHLFHDASNFIAMETFPSVYSKTRRRALEHTLERFHNDEYENAPYFLFGDFNFRTDTAGVIKKLTEDTHESKLSSKGNISRLQFRNNEENLILTLGKKEFSHCEHRHVFAENSGRWLREYDRELEDFEGRLFEFPIEFVPSYPFEEDIKQGANYMQTRVPAWCDRILLSPTAKTLVENISSSDSVEYGIIGATTCMGDHKPVYLRAILSTDAGMINCCNGKFPQMCFKVPDNYHELLSMLPGCETSYSRVRSNDRVSSSTGLLHAVPIEHDPYTPDSMDSPSPSTFAVPTDSEIQELDPSSSEPSKHHKEAVKRLDSAVSPALLKSRLELIVQINENAERERRKKKDLSECRLRSWPDTDDSNLLGMRQHRCNSDVSWQRHWHEEIVQRNLSDTSSDDNQNCRIIIPRIAIINASNFQSNESSVHSPQEERLDINYHRQSDSKDGTSGDGSSLELDIDDVQSDFHKRGGKVSAAQDSGLDTLDVDDGFSRGGSTGFSSNETTSTLPLDSEKDECQVEVKNCEIVSQKVLSNEMDEVMIVVEGPRSDLPARGGEDVDSGSDTIRLRAHRASQRYRSDLLTKKRTC